ncbi:UNVERIFIED_CONTAM: hypothetical protein H355_007025, partial [Colinus virginianus]
VFLAKGSAALEKLKDLCKEGKEKTHPSVLLQLYTQAVLDITYFEESQLVDEDFAGESSLQKVKELICILSDPEDLVRECSLNEEVIWMIYFLAYRSILFQPINILSTDLLECLYWRKGALLYMYCHTAKERSEWLQGNIALFKKQDWGNSYLEVFLVVTELMRICLVFFPVLLNCLQCLNNGVHYLMKMLSFRCPLHLDGDVLLQDKDTARLLSEGVFSDTHLLAMMYTGEMCYWGLKYRGEEKQESPKMTEPVSGSDLGCTSQGTLADFRELGKAMLTKYVAVCEGPLKDQGWNTTSAKQMLCYLRKTHT